ncbi:hypothetical protein CASFOL_023291 [Castilleja foliolosa]|uniref:Uncharacterized protein n=1 Tax=Castilleja foliolosa TaxID=1961234 RepID=A0ABD3CLE8_9LAMI
MENHHHYLALTSAEAALKQLGTAAIFQKTHHPSVVEKRQATDQNQEALRGVAAFDRHLEQAESPGAGVIAQLGAGRRGFLIPVEAEVKKHPEEVEKPLEEAVTTVVDPAAVGRRLTEVVVGLARLNRMVVNPFSGVSEER